MISHTTFAFIDGLGGGELLMIAFIALILFGGKNLPSLARTAGRTMREFKKASDEVQRELRKAIDEAPDADNPVRPLATVSQAQRFPTQAPAPLDAGQIDPAYVSSNPSAIEAASAAPKPGQAAVLETAATSGLSSASPASAPVVAPVSPPVAFVPRTPIEPKDL